ncbi:MAG: hypothetical protein ACAI44_39815 [Candidatus Sericytochromatia bacterium]
MAVFRSLKQCFQLRLWLLLPILLCLGAAESLQIHQGESLLLNVHAGGIEPVAIRGSDGSFRELPIDEQTEAIDKIVASYFMPGQAYGLFRNGQALGQLKVTKYSRSDCSGFGFVGSTLDPAVPTEDLFTRFVAFTPGFPGQRTYAGAGAADATLKQQALDLSRSYYAAKGLRPDQISRMQLDDLQALKLNQGKTPGLMVSSRIGAPAQSETGCNTHHLLLVAELTGQGYVPRLELFKKATQAEGECSGHTFVSSFQAEPDSEYLLVEGWGWEWNWYEIYQRKTDGTYGQVFNGGGGGC